MSGKYVEVDISGLEELTKNIHSAKADLNRELALFLDAAGNDMLRVIQDEIIRLEVVDTRLLLKSFTKGSADNLYKLNSGNLTLEIGTNVEYASYVNDGHWTNPKGVSQRFVPGYWQGDRFIYQSGASTGMLLKQKYVEGKHYMEHSVEIIEKMFPIFIERKLEEWLSKHFE